jgi:hypothetical protein
MASLCILFWLIGSEGSHCNVELMGLETVWLMGLVGLVGKEG